MKEKRKLKKNDILLIIFMTCWLIICIIGWILIFNKQLNKNIEIKDTLYVEELKQKDISFYDHLTESNYLENYTYISSAYSDDNLYYTLNNNVAFGLEGNSFSQYHNINNGTSVVNIEPINFHNTIYEYSWLNVEYYFNNDLYTLFNGSNNYSFGFIPFMCLPQYANNYDLILEEYDLEDIHDYILCSIDFISINNNIETVFCNFSYSTDLCHYDNLLNYYPSGNYYTFTNYTNDTINISDDGYSWGYDSNNKNHLINKISINYYLANFVDYTDFDYNTCNDIIFGLICSTDLSYFSAFRYLIENDGLEPDVVGKYVMHLPNCYQGINYSLYQTNYNRGYNEGYTEGYNNGYTEGYNEGYETGTTDGYNTGYTVGYNTGILAQPMNQSEIYFKNTLSYAWQYDQISQVENIKYYYTNINNAFTTGEFIETMRNGYITDISFSYQDNFTENIRVYLYIPSEPITGNIYTSVSSPEDGGYLSFLTDDYEVITPMYINVSGTYTILNNKKIIAILGVLDNNSFDPGFMFRPTNTNESYTIGYNNGSLEGYNNGLKQGTEEGYNNGYTNGYNTGYQQAITEGTTTGSIITSLFTATAGVPITILNGTMGATIGNIPIVSIIFGMLAIALILWLIRKFI